MTLEVYFLGKYKHFQKKFKMFKSKAGGSLIPKSIKLFKKVPESSET